MSKHVQWLLQLEIKPEKVDDFQSVVQEIVKATEKESDTILYEYYFNEDRTGCNIHERFVDSDAALTHLKGFAAFADRFLGAAMPTSINVYGSDVSDALKEELAGFTPMYFAHKIGFSRFIEPEFI